MIFERTLMYSLYSPRSIYFRMLVCLCNPHKQCPDSKPSLVGPTLEETPTEAQRGRNGHPLGPPRGCPYQRYDSRNKSEPKKSLMATKDCSMPPTQIFQKSLTKEYTINHILNPYLILSIVFD